MEDLRSLRLVPLQETSARFDDGDLGAEACECLG